MEQQQYTVLFRCGTVKHSVRAFGPNDALERALNAEGRFALLDVMDVTDFNRTRVGNRFVYEVENDYYVVIPQ